MSDVLEEFRNDNSCSATICDLPNEVLDHIFSFLSMRERIRTELVCRKWADFGKNYKWSWPKKLTSEMLNDCFEDNGDDVWTFLLSRCGTSLKELKVIVNGLFVRATFRTCYVIGDNCPNLTSIELSIGHPVRDPDAVISITKGCTKLNKISIKLLSDSEGMFFFNEHGNVCLALKECQSLEYLSLDCDSSIIEEGCLDAIGGALKGFSIWPSDYTNFSVVAEKLVRRKDPMEELSLHWCERDPEEWALMVVRHYKNTLRELNLSHSKMSSSIWCKIPGHLQNLQVLVVSSSSLIEDEFLRVVSDSCKDLESLNISYTAITDVGVSYLTELPKLKCLDISKTAVTDVGLSNLKDSPELTALYLNEIESISGEGLLTLAACGRLEKVYFGDIEHRGDLIEESCIALATNCPNLQLLDVNDNVNITHRLVDEFRSSIQHGSLKGPVSLYLSSKQVKEDIEVCENLNLVFDIHVIVLDLTGLEQEQPLNENEGFQHL